MTSESRMNRLTKACEFMNYTNPKQVGPLFHFHGENRDSELRKADHWLETSPRSFDPEPHLLRAFRQKVIRACSSL